MYLLNPLHVAGNMTASEELEKSDRRASCEQCRQKKAKCGGEYPICSRCARLHDKCTYLSKRPMGRPKKRKLQGDDDSLATISPPATDRDHHSDSGRDSDNSRVVDAPKSFPIDIIHDPSGHALWGCEKSDGQNLQIISPPPTDAAQDSCACLATLYLCMDELRRAGPLTLSTGLPMLRDLTAKATEIVQCPVCPNNFMWAMQNAQMANTLILSMAQAYSNIFASIEREAKRAEETNESKLLQLGEPQNAGQLPGLQDSGFGSSAFTVSFSPVEWHRLAKNALRDQIHGAAHLPGTSYLAMLQMLQDRQELWHSRPCSDDPPNEHHRHHNQDAQGTQEPICVIMVKRARDIVSEL